MSFIYIYYSGYDTSDACYNQSLPVSVHLVPTGQCDYDSQVGLYNSFACDGKSITMYYYFDNKCTMAALYMGSSSMPVYHVGDSHCSSRAHINVVQESVQLYPYAQCRNADVMNMPDKFILCKALVHWKKYTSLQYCLWNLYTDYHNQFQLNFTSGLLLSLDLHSQNLHGSIPPAIGNLTQLVELSLHNNNLGGTLPTELGYLSNLQLLKLSNNWIQGSVPSELSALYELHTLSLETNWLSGSIPMEVSSDPSLSVTHDNTWIH